MKSRFSLFKVFALALLLAFSFTACEEWFNFSEENPEPYVPPPLPIFIQNSNYYIRIGHPHQLIVENSENQQLIWSSSNPGVATLSDAGVVHGISSGKAVISVKTSDGKSDFSCDVSIISDPETTYVIENETSWTDEECADMKSVIWYLLAEGENGRGVGGDWTANYIKTNKIKIILSDLDNGFAWIYPDLLDRIYLEAKILRDRLDRSIEEGGKEYDDSYVVLPMTGVRAKYHNFITHETMHLAQYRGDSFSLMAGMRPDICAAAHMLTEFLAWFYTEGRPFDSYVYADDPNAIALQSRYMILSVDPWEYDNERIKDPSLPPAIHSTPWFNNELSGYAQHAFRSDLVRNSAMGSRPVQASREYILRLARSLLACRNPKMAGVNDEALWTVFEALRKAAIGDSKYMFITDYFHPWTVYQPDFDRFQNLIAQWDANYAAQQY
jgi:hypothetical protein